MAQIKRLTNQMAPQGNQSENVAVTNELLRRVKNLEAAMKLKEEDILKAVNEADAADTAAMAARSKR